MINNFKVGDKLLCKDDCWIPNICYHKGREYEVFDLNNYSYVIIDRINNERLFIDESELNLVFYTNQEMRKIKLEKLNEKI